MTKKVALIDGYGFVFRAYFSLPPLTRSDGTPVGAVYGFTNMLIKLLAGLDVSHVAVVFDSGSKTFRNDIYEEYKANRPPCPEDLKPQFPIIRQAAESFNLTVLEKVGFEADDIIATMAKKSAAQGYEVMVVSSDKDLMQLVGENIFMYDAMKNKFIGDEEVRAKFFVGPDKVLDVLSLIGDASDNVPGVKGIGPKTAAELINEFGSLEEIYENLDKIRLERRRNLLKDGIEEAKLSKKLIKLEENVELEFVIEDLALKEINPAKLVEFLKEQGFRSLVSRVEKEFDIIDESVKQEEKNVIEIEKKESFKDVKRIKITSKKMVEELQEKAIKNGMVVIDFWLKGGEISFLTIATNACGEDPDEIFYFEPKSLKSGSVLVDLFGFAGEKDSNEKVFDLTLLEQILLDESIKKIFFDVKSFLKFAKVKSYEDVSLINHLLNSAVKNDLRSLIDINLTDNAESLGFGEIFANIDKIDSNKKALEVIDNAFADEKKKINFFAFRNFAICQLYGILAPRIFELQLNEAYFSYERPFLQVISDMEEVGIKVDVVKLRALSQEFSNKIEGLNKEIYDLAGEEFNIASTKQLSEILFEKLGLNSSKKSKKTGALSTGHGVLEKLAYEGHIIAEKILEFRKFSKLKNTYADALPKEINDVSGRIHSSFSTITTISGRLSSSNPNLQNIPIRTEEGRRIRHCFVADKNCCFIAADYSQIELRVIAHVAKIDSLIKAFKEGKDIHSITASEVFAVSQEDVSDELRSKAKAINFGIIYGISAFGLARQLDISNKEAAKYIKSYLETYPGIDSYMKDTIELARKNGYVKTISGRKCFIKGINDKNPIIRAEAERLAINAPIQGGAADIVKRSMMLVGKKFADEGLKSKIILQIHDELIVESPKNELDEASNILKHEMERAILLDLPLVVDVEVGEFWS